MAGADIDDRGAPYLGSPPSLPAEQRLVQPERVNVADAIGVLDQCRAVGVTASLTVCQSQPSSRAYSATVRPSRPTCSHTHRPAQSVIAPRAGAIRVLGGPRAHLAIQLRTAPPVLVPHQPRRPPEALQVDQLNSWPVLHPRHRATRRALRPFRTRLDVHNDGLVALVVDAEHVHRRQADQQLAQARRVRLHRGSPDRLAAELPILRAPVPRPVDPREHSHPAQIRSAVLVTLERRHAWARTPAIASRSAA
jgi:hypothetical protein